MGWNKGSADSFAGKVRAAARKLGADGYEFSAGDLSHEAGVQTFDGNKRMHWVIRDLKKAGELVVVRKGVYRLAVRREASGGKGEASGVRGEAVGANGRSPGRTKSPAKEKREIMWRFLRMRNVVTVGDLEEAAGVSETYAREWLRMLNRRGVVKKLEGGRWRLMVTDMVEAPHNLEKAEKLRQMRAERRTKLLAALDDAQIRVTQAAALLDVARDELKAMGDE